jgi:hypothetical protein
MTEKDHEEHCRQVSLRALLQLWADRHAVRLVRRKRRPGRLHQWEQGDGGDQNNVHLDTFLEGLAESYDLSAVNWDYRTELRTLYAEMSSLFSLTETLTGLQFLLQGITEGVLLEDRRVFLQQEGEGIVTSQVWEIFDEELSPRNKMLFAYRS